MIDGNIFYRALPDTLSTEIVVINICFSMWHVFRHVPLLVIGEIVKVEGWHIMLVLILRHLITFVDG